MNKKKFLKKKFKIAKVILKSQIINFDILVKIYQDALNRNINNEKFKNKTLG